VSVARGWHRAGSAAPAVQTLLPRCYAGAEGVEGADTSRAELLVSRRYTNTLGAVASLSHCVHAWSSPSFVWVLTCMYAMAGVVT
jgi:hypothetical protein